MRFKLWLEKSEGGVPKANPDPGSFGKEEKIKTDSNAEIKASKGDEKSGKEGTPSTSVPWKNYTQKCDHGHKADGSCRGKEEEA